MKCKKCGAELPAGAKFCDICGTKIVRETYEQRAAREAGERNRARKKRMIIRAAIGAGILVLLFILWHVFWYNDIPHDPNIYRMSNKVSAEQYAKISEGLTYEQVKEELGKGAKYTSFGNVSNGFTSYVWPGEYIDKSLLYAEVTVYIDHGTNKVDQYSERNVIDGKEIYENLTKERKSMTKKKKEEIEATIKPGMTYEQVVDFLGTGGILKESESNSDGNEQKTYDWTYYDENYYKTDFTIYFNKGKVRELYMI